MVPDFPADTKVNLIVNLPSANVASIGNMFALKNNDGKTYPCHIGTNGVNVDSYMYHDTIPTDTRLIGELWYKRNAL